MSIIADTLYRLQSIRQKDEISALPSPTPGTSSHPASSSHRLRKNNPRLTSRVLTIVVIVTLTALGLSMIWGEKQVGTEKSPAHPEQIATPFESHVPGAPEANPSSPTKVSPLEQVPLPQKESRNQAGQQNIQRRDQSEADDIPISAPSPSPVLPINTFLQEEVSTAKASISQATNDGVTLDMDPAPQTLPRMDDVERLTQGSSLVRKRLYLEAMEVLEPLFASPPVEGETWFWMGTAQMGLGRYDEARKYFREGLARDETIPELWVQYALVEHQRGRYSHALDLLRQAELLAPTLPHVHLNLAFTLESQGNPTSAIQHYRKYLSLTNRNPLTFSTRKKVLDRILNLGRS